VLAKVVGVSEFRGGFFSVAHFWPLVAASADPTVPLFTV
jgi:hypothetical protein